MCLATAANHHLNHLSQETETNFHQRLYTILLYIHFYFIKPVPHYDNLLKMFNIHLRYVFKSLYS